MNMAQVSAFVLYFLVVLAIGIYFFMRDRSGDDKQYFLGGRSTGPWVTALSAQASDMSGWLLMGFPGSLLAFGMGELWIGIGLALGTAANWIFVAARLRRFSKAANDSITLPQYLTNRFATADPGLKIVCAVIFLISFTIYVASAFVSGQTVLCALFPWFAEGREHLALAVFALIILLYTFLGGYLAVCWTDFFQGLMMLGAILLVPIAMALFGQFDESYYSAFAQDVSVFNTDPFAASPADIASGLAWGLGYFGMPHILVRFMSIEKPSMVKKSASVAIVWVVLTLGAASAIAILGRTYLLSDGTSLAALLLPGSQQNIFIVIVQDMFPSFIAGLLLAAIIAAAMSTADSQLLVASSSFTSDIYKPILRKNKSSDREIATVSRLVVVVVSAVAYCIAASGSAWASSIMAMVENAWGLFGSAFGPVVILSLFWKRFNYAGAIAGVIGGAVVDLGWLIFFSASTGIYEILPGFIAGAVIAVLVSLLTPAPSAEVDAIFAAATNSDIDD